ncbi:hypothetical protein R3P38DRAFT_2758992 [Favolaschia claudopus]|uniref:Uncharacterized protein n=1 Tax=Favolaschia claudopus TaxID=2862362 RepID=A0AAW0E415_9AGAR
MEGGMQLDGEASALPHLVTTSSSQLSFASSSVINAIYYKTAELRLNSTISHLSSTRSSASSIVEMSFSKTAASTGAQTKPSAQRASSGVSAVRYKFRADGLAALASKDAGVQPDAKRQRFLVKYPEALRTCFNAPNSSYLSRRPRPTALHLTPSRVNVFEIELERIIVKRFGGRELLKRES